MTATFGPSVAAVVSLECAAMWRSEMEHQFTLHLKHTRPQSFREKYDVQTTFRRFCLSENDEFQNQVRFSQDLAKSGPFLVI
eukprot:96228-Prorocentrum_minimum.AAC.1